MISRGAEKASLWIQMGLEERGWVGKAVPAKLPRLALSAQSAQLLLLHH